MTTERPHGLMAHLPMLWPAGMLVLFFVVPFGIMLAVSFFHQVQGAFFEPAFELDNYGRFVSAFFGRALLFSLWISILSAAIVVAVAFPFTYFLTRLRRRAQVPILVFILAVLSLSEVIIGFSWSTLLSRNAGLSNVMVWLGMLPRPVAWTPSFGALLMGMCYLGFPYTVLIVYPAMSRLDPELPEASRMLGASPFRTFFTIVVPVLKTSLMGAVIMVFVFNLGAFLLPQVLGRPPHWTLSVHITDQAVFQSNIPFAAAMAIFLMLFSLAFIGLTLVLGASREAPR
ncbi:MAG TPA: ABC transporter permease [Geminicoccus sp.]|jgi:putative spermidine/putrescine transport system permease protein|uniref:ABC transporter permease n=1 Tax=Geminicoccus sp. TaxID=2024832 RepID=UPI002E3096B4|nr:ABC transporter permease [Geminicoccus sp.]HEX2527012.1 ABC transporter permease [Geminicoccus sp.]